MNKKMLDRAFFGIQKTLRASLSRITSSPQDIDDMMQETYLRAVANNTSNSIKDPEGYLFRASRNIALNEKAKMHRRLEVALPVEEMDSLTVLMTEGSVEEDFDVKRQFAEFCLAVSDLPIQCRKVFVLRKVYGFSQNEISKKLSISVSTVESHIAKGMMKTRQSMSKHHHMQVATSVGGKDGKL